MTLTDDPAKPGELSVEFDKDLPERGSSKNHPGEETTDEYETEQRKYLKSFRGTSRC